MSDKDRIESIYQLSPLQEGMLFHTASDSESGVYFEQNTYDVRGRLDLPRFRCAWQRVVDRHSVLRTAFNKAGTAQVVFKKASPAWICLDLRELPDEQRASEFRNFLRQDRCNEFDVTTAPLIRFAIVRLTDTTNKFVVTYHHLILDGWSTVLILKEAAALYASQAAGAELRLEEARPYRDYVRWVRSQDPTRTEAFWRRRLAGLVRPTYLADGLWKGSPAGKAGEVGGEMNFAALGLTDLSRRYQVTLNTIVQGAWALVLSRHTGDKDLVFGTTVSCRPGELAGVENMTGLFINTIAVRICVDSVMRVGEWLRRVQQEQAESYEYQHAQLAEVQRYSGVEQRYGLFDTLVVFENYPTSGVSEQVAGVDEGLVVTEGESWERVSYPVALVVSGSEQVRLKLLYDEGLITRAKAEQVLAHVKNVLAGISADGEQLVSAVKILDEREEKRILQLSRGKSSDYREEVGIEELIRAIGRRRPNAIAVVDTKRAWTYRQLDEQAERFGMLLRSRGVKEDNCVGVLLPSSVDAVWAMLGIWKAGAAYVPLDDQNPEERLREMIDDCGMKLVVSRRDVGNVATNGCEKIFLDDFEIQSESSSSNEQSVPSSSRLDRLAYVVYTSGSSGKPKGVAITHRGLQNLATWHIAEYALSEADRITQIASLGFDAAVWEIWPGMAVGARLEIVPQAARESWIEWARWMSERKITMSFLPTPLAEEALNERVKMPDTLRVILTGGDRLRRWAEPDARYALVNHYGPTENTVVASCGLVESSGEGLPPVGKPIANTQLYVLDRDGELCPIGVTGELYIGGSGVARGYIGRAALTAERFVPNSFSQQSGRRMYRTGDLVRWGEHGELEFIGRNDQQVKVRGHRIELAEIEAALSSHDAVKQCVVVATENGSASALVGYVVGDAEEEQLKQFITGRLPACMVPQRIVNLEQMPLTHNGKIDRKALPQPEQTASDNDTYLGPRTQMEESLCGIWSSVLGGRRIGIRENFFELGGHSLLAMSVVSRLRAAVGVELSPSILFELPTVEGVAGEIERLMKIGRGEMGKELGRADRRGKLPLSFAQQRLWFTDQLDGGSVAYNVPLAVRLNGELNVRALREAVREIVRRHEVLRTSFPCENGEPEQEIGEGENIKLEAVDLGGVPETARYAMARRMAEDELVRGFNLATGPLVRVMLVSSSQRENVLVVVMHHIVSDGWSTGILIKELSELYQAFLAGRESPLKALKYQYADYAVWQRNWLNGDVVEQEMSYWRKQLDGLERMEMAGDGKRCGNGAAEVVRMEIGKALSERLREIKAREELTMFMILTAAFQVLLSRLTGQSDIAIGTDVANRNRVELEGLVGFFINQLVLRTRVEPELMVGRLLAEVRQVVIGAYAHQNVPFEKVVEEMSPDRAGGSPLFSAKLIMQNAPGEDLAIGAVKIESFNELLPPGAKLDLHVAVEERQEGMAFVITYPQGRFQRQRINRLARQFTRTLEFLAEHPEKQIRELNIEDDGERDRVLVLGQGCRKEVRETVVELFERQAAERPDVVAVVSNGQSYTYDQVSRHSNQLGRFLVRMGARPETRVGICLTRSGDFVLAVLGIWKAGAAYVAVDAEDPEDRKAALLEDAGVAIVLTNSLLKPGLSHQWATVVSLDDQAVDISTEESGPLALSPIPQSLAYVMYTSGSSGKPKGVAIEHRQITNYVTAIVERLGLVPQMTYALVSTLAADLGHTVMFPALATGGTLHLIDEWVARDGNLMRDYILSQGIQCIKMTPSHLRLWMSSGLFSLPSRKLVLGGEALGKQWIEQVRNLAQQCEIWNHYGPTETTVGVTAGRVRDTEGHAIPLGRPIANTQLYVLDEGGALCGIGVPGELYIGGAGVARGYMNRPGHTAERFVPDGFSEERGARLYRSGDVARWTDEGEIEFLGRKDQQVKVRGYRIELAEIETVMMRQAGVNQCVVCVREIGEGSQMLVAYVTGDVREEQLRKELSTELPGYMVPGRIVKVEHIPLTGNGKIDRKALEQITELQQEREERFEAPRSEIEELLCGIWAEVLDRERVGIRENFFDLGGHSLIATQVVSRIRALFGVEVPLRVMFDTPTVEALAVEVELESTGGRRQSAPQLAAVERTGRLPLSFAQQRLWFIDQLEPGNPVYNCPRVVRLEGKLKVWGLREALTEIVRRHEVLRTSFPAQGGDPEQKIHDPHEMELPVLDLAQLAGPCAEQVGRELAEKEAVCSFNLGTGPLFRATVVKISKQENLLVLVMHHIVSDGWSAGVLIRELTALYQAYGEARKSPLDDLPLQYADYAIWQRNWLKGEVLEQELNYWRQQLDGIDRLELPTDRPRTALASKRAQVISFQFAQPLAEKLRELCRSEGVTLFMTLVAAYQLLLSRYTGQSDVAIGTVVANRNQLQIENLLGFFINQLVLRTQLDHNWSVRQLLREVREVVLAAYAHQDLPFEKLVEELAVQRDLSRAPLFDYAIELQTLREGRPWETGDIRFSSIDLDITTTKLDLDLLLYDDQCCIIGYAYYNSDLFSAETISKLINGFQPILEQFVCDAGAELSDIWPGDESTRYEELLSTSLEMLEV